MPHNASSFPALPASCPDRVHLRFHHWLSGMLAWPAQMSLFESRVLWESHSSDQSQLASQSLHSHFNDWIRVSQRVHTHCFFLFPWLHPDYLSFVANAPVVGVVAPHTTTPIPAVIMVAASHGTAPRVIAQQAQRPCVHTQKTNEHAVSYGDVWQNSD